MAFAVRCTAELLLQIICHSFHLIPIFPAVSSSGQVVQPRFLHGLSSENPMTLSPSAYGFFHPDKTHPPLTPVQSAPMPVPSTDGDHDHDQPLLSWLTDRRQSASESSGKGIGGACGAAVIVLGLLSVVLVAGPKLIRVVLRPSSSSLMRKDAELS